MRVSISAIGSVILMFCLRLPAGFCQAGNFAIHGGFTQLVTAKAELAIHAVRTTRYRAACTLPCRAAVAWQLVELRLCNSAFFVRAVNVANDRLERLALLSLLRYQLGTLEFTRNHRLLSHVN